MRILPCLLCLCLTVGLANAQEPLRTVRDVRNLKPAEATQRLPVLVRGVVTYADPNRPSGFFLQDDTAGIYVRNSKKDRQVQREQYIEIRGVTGPGEFAPIIEADDWTDLGKAPLPLPMSATYTDLAGGPADSQFVELRGVIRNVQPHPGRETQVDIVTEGHRVRSNLPANQVINADELVDAEVRVRGVCVTHFHDRRWLAAWLRVALTDQIGIEKPPPFRAFEQEPQLATSLLSFDPKGQWLHRVRVQGVVTGMSLDQSIFLQDESGPVKIVPVEPEAVSVGDNLDVIGFVRGAELHPVLEDAVIRRRGQAVVPPPHIPKLKDVLAGRESGQLIRVQGRLIDQMDSLSERLLLIENEGRVFQAHLPGTGPFPAKWERGSHVEATGVCLVPLDSTRHQSSGFEAVTFQLQLRSPADVTVLLSPPWWTAQRIGYALLTVGAVLIAAIAWAASLHSRVRRQTQLIEEKVKRHAVLEERNRIARDLHDTLTQSLAGVTFQLEGIRGCLQTATAPVREQFSVAVNMLRHSLAEARRSVMNLRALGLEGSDLLQALEETTRPLVKDSTVKLYFIRQGAPASLPTRVEHHLLRLGQEAIANALQHSGCRSIRVLLSRDDHTTVLEIRDDGCGFDAQRAAPPGHFGLIGMRERANQVQGKLDIETAVGHGSVVRLTIPNTLEPSPSSSHA